jgi:hypothetical protein
MKDCSVRRGSSFILHPSSSIRLSITLPSMAPESDARRKLLGAARQYLLESPEPKPGSHNREPAPFVPPRLTFAALQEISMSRSRDRILANLEEMYTEAFKRAKEAEDPAQMASLDFAYRREQLYFEILLDVRDAVEKRG